jgi:hypothetical protein
MAPEGVAAFAFDSAQSHGYFVPLSSRGSLAKANKDLGRGNPEFDPLENDLRGMSSTEARCELTVYPTSTIYFWLNGPLGWILLLS